MLFVVLEFRLLRIMTVKIEACELEDKQRTTNFLEIVEYLLSKNNCCWKVQDDDKNNRVRYEIVIRSQAKEEILSASGYGH